MPWGAEIYFPLLFPCLLCQAGMHQSPSHHWHPHNLTPWTDTRDHKSIDQGRCLCQGHEHVTSALSSLLGSGYLPLCLGGTLAWCVPGICNHQPSWTVSWPWLLLLDLICSSCLGAVGLGISAWAFHSLLALPLVSPALGKQPAPAASGQVAGQYRMLGFGYVACWGFLVGFGGGFCFGLFSLLLASLILGNCWEFIACILGAFVGQTSFQCSRGLHA